MADEREGTVPVAALRQVTIKRRHDIRTAFVLGLSCGAGLMLLLWVII
jgi:hypothetical protein